MSKPKNPTPTTTNDASDPTSTLSHTARLAHFLTGGQGPSSPSPSKPLTMTTFLHLTRQRLQIERAHKKWQQVHKESLEAHKKDAARQEASKSKPRGRALIRWYLEWEQKEKADRQKALDNKGQAEGPNGETEQSKPGPDAEHKGAAGSGEPATQQEPMDENKNETQAEQTEQETAPDNARTQSDDEEQEEQSGAETASRNGDAGAKTMAQSNETAEAE